MEQLEMKWKKRKRQCPPWRNKLTIQIASPNAQNLSDDIAFHLFANDCHFHRRFTVSIVRCCTVFLSIGIGPVVAILVADAMV